VGNLADGHAVFLHGFQQCRLSLGRGAVDLVSQNQVGEHRSGLKLQNLFTALALAQHVATHDVSRHQVGRELNAGKFQMQHVGKRLYELGLAGAGNAFDEAVAARQQAGEDSVDDFFIAYDHARHLRANAAEFFLEAVNLHVGCRVVHFWFRSRARKYSLTAPRYASGIRSPLKALSVT